MKSSVGLLLLLSPFAVADEEIRTAELLRELSRNQNSWSPDPALLSRNPEILLDIIFTPEDADACPPETLREAKIWIRRLGEETYSDREEAIRKLISLGPDIRPILEESQRDSDPEIRLRSRQILVHLKDYPPLDKLDYSWVSIRLRGIIRRIKDDATLDFLAVQCLERIGQPTAHGQEELLAKQVFSEHMLRGTPETPAIMRRALGIEHRGLRNAAASAISGMSAGNPPGAILLDGLTSGDPEVLSILLTRLPDVKEGGDAVEAYRKALKAIASRNSLPEPTRIAAYQSLLCAFHDAESLRILVETAGREHPDPVTQAIAQALTDPRLSGIALDGAARAADLIDHPSAEIRRAAGVFLLTRPDREERHLGLAFSPHLGREGEKQLERLWAGMSDPASLREELETLADQGGRNSDFAWRLLDFLPEEYDLSMPPPAMPFGF